MGVQLALQYQLGCLLAQVHLDGLALVGAIAHQFDGDLDLAAQAPGKYHAGAGGLGPAAPVFLAVKPHQVLAGGCRFRGKAPVHRATVPAALLVTRAGGQRQFGGDAFTVYVQALGIEDRRGQAQFARSAIPAGSGRRHLARQRIDRGGNGHHPRAAAHLAPDHPGGVVGNGDDIAYFPYRLHPVLPGFRRVPVIAGYIVELPGQHAHGGTLQSLGGAMRRGKGQEHRGFTHSCRLLEQLVDLGSGLGYLTHLAQLRQAGQVLVEDEIIAVFRLAQVAAHRGRRGFGVDDYAHLSPPPFPAAGPGTPRSWRGRRPWSRSAAAR